MSRWQATRLVMRRELGERIREKSFLVSTCISVLIIGVVALLPSFLGDGPDELRVGAVGAEQQVLARALEASTTRSDDLRIEARDVVTKPKLAAKSKREISTRRSLGSRAWLSTRS